MSAEPIWSNKMYDWSYADFAGCNGNTGSQTKSVSMDEKEKAQLTNTGSNGGQWMQSGLKLDYEGKQILIMNLQDRIIEGLELDW